MSFQPKAASFMASAAENPQIQQRASGRTAGPSGGRQRGRAKAGENEKQDEKPENEMFERKRV